MSSTHIRWMIRHDMPAVLDIESASFSQAWSEDDFINVLRQRNCIGMVAERGDQIAGFMVYELHKNRLHILNFAVSSEFRRSGVGSAMIQKLKSKLSPERRNRLIIEVRESNLHGQLFFRDQGFKAVMIQPKFFGDTLESAYAMQFRVDADPPQAPAVPDRLKQIHALALHYHNQLEELTSEAATILGDRGEAEGIVLAGVEPEQLTQFAGGRIGEGE